MTARFSRSWTFSALVALTVSLGFAYWYSWSAKPLTTADIDTYMQVIEAQVQEPGGKHDLVALRRFLSEDDGAPFYTVNLYKFHATAAYPSDADLSGSGRQAYDRFANVMIKLMLGRGSHPVFASSWADKPNSDWDRVVIVRYRSRRDLVDLFATEAFAEASMHKWASLAAHNRMVVKAISIPDGRIVIWLLALIAVVAACLSWWSRRPLLKR